MTYVLDTSVAIAWVVARATSAAAIRVRRDFLQGVHELIAPSHFRIEIASALTKCERQRVTPVGHAYYHYDDIMTSQPTFFSFEPLIDRALHISSATRAGLNDCLYVALAESEGCEFLTDDLKLIADLQSRFPLIQPLAAMP